MQTNYSVEDSTIARVSLNLAKALNVDASHTISQRLSALAEGIAGLPNIVNVTIVALDSGEHPVAAGSNKKASMNLSAVEFLSEIERSVLSSYNDDSTWAGIERFKLPPLSTDSFLHVIKHIGRKVGIVIVELQDQVSPELSALSPLKIFDGLLANGIEQAIKAEDLKRMSHIRNLVGKEFRKSKPRIESIAVGLKTIYHASCVSVFLRDQNRLRLSRTTDSKLGLDKPVVYEPDQGLTGTIFSGAEPIRLTNTNDGAEIKRKYGIERIKALHSERDVAEDPIIQFLGVPMRSHAPDPEQSVGGVIRISRSGSTTPFSQGDEDSLQFFADLMGSYLRHYRDLLISGNITNSESEAIVVTRQQFIEGASTPIIVQANPGATKLSGRSLKELIGRDASKIYDPDDYQKVKERIIQDIQGGRKESKGSMNVKIRTADGRKKSVSLSYRLLTDTLIFASPNQRLPLYVIGIMRDTTVEQLDAQQHERLRDMLDKKGFAYYRANRNGETVETTESELTGYSITELLKMNRKELYVFPDERLGLIEKARANQGKLTSNVQYLRKKDGTKFYVSCDIRVLYDKSGNEIGTEGIYQDVTDRFRLQRYIDAGTDRVLFDHELLRGLAEAAKNNIDYLATLGHQLQSPLASLAENLIDLNSGDAGIEDVKDDLPYCIEQTHLCTLLVRNLTQMDTVLRGDPLEMKLLDMLDLIEDTVDRFVHTLRLGHLNLELDKNEKGGNQEESHCSWS